MRVAFNGLPKIDVLDDHLSLSDLITRNVLSTSKRLKTILLAFLVMLFWMSGILIG